MAKYVCGIDAGTTGCTVMITTLDGGVVGTGYREYPCSYPQAGWVEQDMEEVWRGICAASQEVLSRTGIDPKEIGSIGFSSQRGTFVCIDESWNCLHPSIVWNCNRGSGAEIEYLRERITPEEFHDVTGTALYANWSLPKIMWVKNNRPDVWERTWKIVNGQEWFLHRLGSEELFSDPSSLTLSGMLQIDALDWSDRVLELAGIPRDMLPPVRPPMRQVGEVSRAAAEASGLAAGTPLCVGGGDQQCAAVGSGVIREGLGEITVGTAAVMVACSSVRREDPRAQVLHGGHAVPGMWDIEGEADAAGAALRWYRDTFGQVESETADKLGISAYDLITAQAEQAPPGCKGAIFFPFFVGQVTPNYVHNARGGALGLSFQHDRSMIARSVLEGSAYESRMIVEAMEDVIGTPFESIRLSGGGAKSRLWSQIQADVYGRPVELLKVPECTTLGATMLGATATGMFANIEEAVDAMVHPVGYLEPDEANHAMYDDLYDVFTTAFDALTTSGAYDKIVAAQSKYWGA
ncbi:Xylulose kinase [Actinomycetales bacterium JB111]|nr:Xylulose kinase [Actinomycetales bacterium JB111]